ncbi:MAG: LytR/AlgR family response regulator transcription factor [Saprospiraceae bacterium]
MKVRCLIVDDEPLAIRLIEKHVAQIESFEVVATCNTALKAFEILNTEKIDLLFLDIKMPSITGIDFLKSLRHPPKTILTTAYRNYALESYSLDVVDYLLKPITFDRFFKAVERYLRENPIHLLPQNPATSSSDSEDVFILLKSGSKYHKVAINSILYIESLKDYIKVHTTENRIVSKYKISDIEKELAGKSFLRIHRSFIVNKTKVTAFTPHDVEIGKVEIPIGVSYKGIVLEILGKV